MPSRTADSVTTRCFTRLAGVMVLLEAIGSLNSAAAASVTARKTSLVARYFSDLNRHQYIAAARLEATCNAVLYERIPGSTIVSSSGLHGRSALMEEARSLQFVRAAHVRRIRPYATPLLARYHIVGADVIGWYRFVYPRGPVIGAVSSHIPSGFYHIRVIVRPCGNTLGIDSEWRVAGGNPSDPLGGICKVDCKVPFEERGCRRFWPG